MSPNPVHHRSTWLKQSNKGHKRTHRSNREVNRLTGGKIQQFRSRSGTVTSSIGSGLSKYGRKNRLNSAIQLRNKKKNALLSSRRMGGVGISATTASQIGHGKQSGTGAPCVIGVVALGENADAISFAKMLLGPNGSAQESPLLPGQPRTFTNQQSKFRGTVLVAERTSLSVLDITKVADIVCFILPVGSTGDNVYSGTGKRCALESYLENAIDVKGRTFITLAKNQGLPTVLGVVQNLDTVSKKHQTAVRRQASLFFETEFGPGTKLVDGGSSDDRMQDEKTERNNHSQLFRIISEAKLKHVTWRSERSYMLADSADFNLEDNTNNVGTLTVRGYLRGQPLGVHQLMHIPGHGTYQIKQIDSVPDPYPVKTHKKSKKEKFETLLVADPSKLPSLTEEATPDLMEGEQTWPTAEEMDVPSNTEIKTKKKKNEYQSAWNVGDESEEEEVDDNGEKDDIEIDDEDDKMNEEMVKEWRQRRLEERDEVMFPDEVEVPLGTPARERFARYRGLKSFRSSPWHPKESLPAEYAYIFQLGNINAVQKAVLEYGREKEEAWFQSLHDTKSKGAAEATMDVETEEQKTVSDKIVPGFSDSVCPGSFIAIHLSNVPSSVLDAIKSSKLPLILGSLLDHEQKLTVVNCNVQRLNTYDKPVKSRQLLTLHCGFWRRAVRPTFSENNLNCDKHKMDRFLQPGRWTVASVYAPITFGTNIPTMFFDEEGELVAAGSLLDLNADRIVLKKAVLTGYPLRIKKKNAVVRFMFHTPEDIKWFKPIELWTKYGASGRITDSLGTHGLYKANFDRIQKSNDTICMSLYKRVFPKPVNEFASLRTLQ